MERRDVLKLGAASVGALAMPKSVLAHDDRKRSFRMAHITDMHVMPEKESQAGLEKCLEIVQGFKPDVIYYGGDLVMDLLGCDLDRAKAQWNVFDAANKAALKTKTITSIGNHDVWGWNNRIKYQNEPMFGKQFVLDRLEMDTPYFSQLHGIWKIIVLDSTHRMDVNGYTAKLDDKQFEWLESELKSTPKTTPIAILSHIPILSPCAYLDGDNVKDGNWLVPGAWMHIDLAKIKDLFLKHKNVKACFSGHMHQVDRADYHGVEYYCNGAVSGGWWNGGYLGFNNGYAIVDFFEDGTVKNDYREFDWVPKPSLG
ncbi:MAG: metallophosphoesterase [Armatimonadetes bacterium]|nr:metallophosphoesterase [Armatimonadota bacterium]